MYNSEKQKLEVNEIKSFDSHQTEVWRVEWNITGTILASSGDDGTVRLWKKNFANEWKCLSIISGNDEED
jgi:nucleoporin SEH1